MNVLNPRPLSDLPPPENDLFGWRTLYHWALFVLRSPGRHKALASCAFLAVLLGACFAIYVVPFRYQVQATLLAGYPQVSALLNPTDRSPDATHAARDVLLKRENLRAILEETDFVDQYLERRPWAIRAKDRVFEFIRGEPRERSDLEEGLLDTFEERLWVSVHREGNLTITLQWWDPELARQVVDAAQRSFIQARRGSEIEAIGEAIKILEGQKARLDVEIERAIVEFEEKQEKLEISPPTKRRIAPRAPAADTETKRLQVELSEKQRNLVEMEEARRERIARVQAELVQQESVYASSHPTIQGTQRVLKTLSEPPPKAVELRREIERLEREIQARGGRAVRHLGDPFLEARLRLDTEDPRLDFERGQLENLLRQHAELRNRIERSKVDQELAEVAFSYRYSVVTPAKLPRGPIKPYPILFLIGGVLGGIGFAFFAATAADLRRGTLIERWQVEHQFGLPILLEMKQPREFPRK